MLILLSLIPAGKTVTHSPIFENGTIRMNTTVKRHTNPFAAILSLIIIIILVGVLFLIIVIASL